MLARKRGGHRRKPGLLYSGLDGHSHAVATWYPYAVLQWLSVGCANLLHGKLESQQDAPGRWDEQARRHVMACERGWGGTLPRGSGL